MRILIIGGTRFVGYLLAWRLLAGGHRVSLLCRGTLPDPFGQRVERLRCDRTTPDLERLLSARSFDAVVDFACYTGNDARGVVRALTGRVGHYVVISTGQVYLVREGCPRPSREADYDGPLLPEPSDPEDRADWLYGMGKREAEDVLEAAWARERFPSTRIRIPMVNGERDHFRRIESYLWRLLDGGPILLPVQAGQRGAPILCRHVYGADVARAIAEMLGDGKTHGQAYNLSQSEEPSLEELLRALAEILGARPRLVSLPQERLARHGLRPVDVSPFSGRWMSRLDPARAAGEIGFRPTPLHEVLQRIVASFLAHPPAAPPPSYSHRPLEMELAQS